MRNEVVGFEHFLNMPGWSVDRLVFSGKDLQVEVHRDRRRTLACPRCHGAMTAIRRLHGVQLWNNPTRIQVRRTYLFTIVTDWFQRLMTSVVTAEGLELAMAKDIADLVRCATKRRPNRSESHVRKSSNGRSRAN